MAKKSKSKNPNLKWPKTQQAKLRDLKDQGDMIGAVIKAGQMLNAADGVALPKTKKLLQDAVNAVVSAGVISGAEAQEHHADKFYDTNKAWDEVNSIYLQCLNLLKTPLLLSVLLKCEALTALVHQKKLLIRNVLAITRDVPALAADLEKIRKMHDGKMGGAATELELAESCTVFTQYVEFMERYDAALMPLVVHASEQLQEALLDLYKINPELAAELDKQLQEALAQIRDIVISNTGADVVETPMTQVAEAPTEAVTVETEAA